MAESARKGYHHGDLPNALVEAAIELARAGGPEAIVLREAARRVGVSATSAYRHFANHQDLIIAVKAHAQQELTRAMASEPVASETEAGAQALARLHALGRGYVRFAQTESGWFRSAFTHEVPTVRSSESFRLLTDALDGLVAAGVLPASRRPGAETPVWATIHGIATLLVDGPLASLPASEQQETIARTQQFITRALIG
ncbi:TetR/AcrR family transcriptional regulator [Nocardia sp. CS682]|uniref:TetR/AcrR family transcriptional regulator n=1 Tax=Nocardia sp. CS682 TaxID=1047172 RepID=UPI001074FDEF|nr:TetR/AcrR family transcriptional regulator [Nocardia sp. CS682]QBS45062.1 TetR family transcriptional regulator [Nocardia sp. CS682]